MRDWCTKFFLMHCFRPRSSLTKICLWEYAMGNPLCDTLWIAELSMSEPKRLNMQDMRYCVECLSAVVNVGAHGHLFFSLMQSKTWNELLVGEEEGVVMEERVVEIEEAWNKRTTVFQMTPKSIYYALVLGIFQSDPE